MFLRSHIPVRQPIQPPDHSVSIAALREYRALAEKLGVASPPDTEPTIRLQAFLREEGYDIYPLQDVCSYLTRMAHKNYKGWGWSKIRGTDFWPVQLPPSVADRFEERSSTYHVTYGEHRDRYYDRPIPYPVLLTIASLKEAAAQRAAIRYLQSAERIESGTESGVQTDEITGPIKLGFYVADFYEGLRKARPLDPFLGVAIDGSEIQIIERWDEPAFRLT